MEGEQPDKTCHQQGNGNAQGMALRGRDLEILPLHLDEKGKQESEDSPPALPPPIFLYPGARKPKQQGRDYTGMTGSQGYSRTSPPSSSSSGYPDPASPGSGGLSPTSSLPLMMMMMNYTSSGSNGGNDKVQKSE